MTETMKRIALAARPKGAPSLDDFRLEDVPMPIPGEDEVLARVLYLSLDPYMRGRMDDAKSYAAPVEIGATMEGGCVAEVIASNSDRLKPGEIVNGMFGWASHGVLPAKQLRKVDPDVAPVSTAVGVLGMPGFTGWLGLNEYGRPKAGETLVVGAATGAVGSMVGQLAKIYGLRVVGVAGGADKCAFAVNELGFDACIDHRAAADATALREQLAAECPDGIDIYFENVGGKTLEAVLPQMNVGGRIPICGMIAWYDLGGLGLGGADGKDQLPKAWRTILVRRLSINGFIIMDHYARFPDFLKEVGGYIRDDRLHYREDIAKGLEAAPQAFLDMLKGGNFGKQLVKVGEL
ncbi:NADP-dependent oxidoreductase [uncultured Roseibium sp.]|uniref:NADP-dependent oxidoreductase n=1 Tax=uncultured Roseibium sp. TaxID=1936171 RepID=UPI003217878F